MSPPTESSTPTTSAPSEQRRADALAELVTGRRAHTLEPLPVEEGEPGTVRRNCWLASDLGLIGGARPGGSCENLDTGPVPPSDNLSPDSSVCGKRRPFRTDNYRERLERLAPSTLYVPRRRQFRKRGGNGRYAQRIPDSRLAEAADSTHVVPADNPTGLIATVSCSA